MLYLRQSVDSNHQAPAGCIPIAELTAIGLERALLTADAQSRCRELLITLTRDPALGAWVVETAERRLGRTDLSVQEAARWLAGCLETELAGTLTRGGEDPAGFTPPSAEIEWRLPALARRLAEYERRLATFNARLEHEKLEALKELAYGASHEINNPLANIAARAQTLLQDEADPERQRKLSAIQRQAMRAHEMIADLMLFARPPKLEPTVCDLGDIVRQVVEEFRESASEQKSELACEINERPIQIVADATQIAVAVQAVVRNALEAIGEGGHVRIAVRQIELGGQPRAEITVRDDGPGISNEVRQHLFDPFYSGREAGRGLGFGLSKCWRIVTDHGGEVVVDRPAASGAEFTIFLPLAPSAVSTE